MPQNADLEMEPVYDDERLPALRRRRLWKKYRWLLWLLLMLPFVYLAVQVFIILAPRMRYETVFAGSMTDALSVKGQVVLESVPVEAVGGIPYYTVPVGQRVAVGGEVATVFSTEQELVIMDRLQAIDQELALLEEAQHTVAEGGDLQGLLDAMQAGIYDMLGTVETGNYGSIEGPVQAATLAANKMQIATGQVESFQPRIDQLNALKAEYEQHLQPIGAIFAPETGYFVPSGQKDAVQRDLETVSAYTPQELQRVLEQPPSYYGDNVAGHIITDYKWRFFAVVTAKQAEKFVVGSKGLQLVFPDAGDAGMPVTVERVEVDEAAGIATVELMGEYVSPEILQLRVENAQVVFGEMKGIRVPKTAMRLVDIENEDGMMLTYKGVYVKFDNMVYFKKIDVLIEDEFYMIVPATVTPGVNEVEMYDEVVVDTGGVELHDRKIL